MKILVPFAEGFEEIEAFTIVDVLRRAGIRVDTVSITGTMVTGAHGVKVMVDKKLADIKIDEYDGIVLPGGMPGAANLGRSVSLIEMIKKLFYKGKLVAAICASPIILAKAGLLDNKKATIYPGMEKELPYPRGEKVVVDGNVITSQGPGTAMEFALKIVEKLLGLKKALELKEKLVA
jgi:4-methyl-5(b-hydroxyethyl)-thiazole monophosphate biosynthesis